MKAAIRREWVKALRSGEYKQTQNVLCRADGSMCCLGVLIDVSQDGDWELDDYADESTVYRFGERVWSPGYEILTAVGMDIEDADRLTELNDTEDADFATIADWIEANL